MEEELVNVKNAIVVLFALCSSSLALEAARSPVTVADCVQVRYITGVWMNQQGSRVAYMVKSPNIEQDRNDYLLYVKQLQGTSADAGQLVATGTEISEVIWLGDGEHLAMLMPVRGVRTVVIIGVADRS